MRLNTGTVIAGSPHDPMVKSISSDLERRGYIVYITVSSTEEEHVVQSENRIDIRALGLDLTTACDLTDPRWNITD